MNIVTKFGIGDVVYRIDDNRKQVFHVCEACEGIGRITLHNDSKFTCPTCHGNGRSSEWLPSAWSVGERLTVGEVRTLKSINAESNEEMYMMHETGIGSGTLHRVERLFATKEEAQAECGKLNDAKETP